MKRPECAMSGCDHTATHRIRLSTVTRAGQWRTLCECCVGGWLVLAQISGARSEVVEIDTDTDADTITVNDVAAAHDALRGYEGPVEGLFA